MDVAYNQHSQRSRRSNRSSTSLNHLSLAPLTSRLPISDSELQDPSPPTPHLRAPYEQRTSYLEGRSAPTTPGVLSRSPSTSRISLYKVPRGLSKSKSSTNLSKHRRQPSKSGTLTPGRRPKRPYEEFSLTSADRNDSDWLLRAGALISTTARESKGQTWLVSRASSTSLTGQNDEDDELEMELARERDSRKSSRRGSVSIAGNFDADDEFSPITTRLSFGPGSRSVSRYGSRVQSRRGSKVNLRTPMVMTEVGRDGYFDVEDGVAAEPDFVNVDEEGEDAQQALGDDIVVRRLARKGTLGLGVWVEKLMGWSLFMVEEDGEDGEDSDRETNDEKTDGEEDIKAKLGPPGELDGLDVSAGEKLPPPGADEGGWHDAAWLLSVATKVLL